MLRKTVVSLLAALLPCSSAAPYNPSVAQQLSYFAASAYCNKSSIDQWTCSHCLNVTYVSRAVAVNTTAYGSAVQAFVAKLNSGGVVLSYRGTEGNDLVNWLVDLAFFQKNVSFPDCNGCGEFCRVT